MSDSYDSRPDTYAHILRVAELLGPVAAQIVERGVQHDRSKLSPPEIETFDRATPRLEYGLDLGPCKEPGCGCTDFRG